MSPTKTDSGIDQFELLDDEAAYDITAETISLDGDPVAQTDARLEAESAGTATGAASGPAAGSTDADRDGDDATRVPVDPATDAPTGPVADTTDTTGATGATGDPVAPAAPATPEAVSEEPPEEPSEEPQAAAPSPTDVPPTDGALILGAAPTPRRRRRARKPILIAVAVIVAMAAAVGGTLAAMAKTVTIAVDGATRQVTTLSGTVDGALTAAGVAVGQHDTLAPAGTAHISDGSQIVIERGRLFSVTIDGTQRKVWTTATTVEAALAQLGQRASDFQLSADRSREIPLSGLSVTADTLHTVTLTDTPAPAGSSAKKAAVTTLAASVANAPQPANADPVELTTAAKTVGDLLAAQGIALGAANRVSPSVDTPLSDGLTVTVTTLPTVAVQVGADSPETVISDASTVSGLLSDRAITLGKYDTVSPNSATPLTQGLSVNVTRISYTTSTKTSTIPQPADKKVDDSSLDKGTTKITQDGHPGKLQTAYRTKIVNGEPGEPQAISHKTLTDAVPTIIHVGTYVAPPPPPASTSSSDSGSGSGSSGSQPSTSGGPGIAVWDRIAQCESTNNWHINTGNGYYGGLQFDIPTWLSNGGGQYAPRADLATKAQQIAIANRVYASRGLTPWQCAYILGLV